jgi:hypothetical protein
VSLRGKIYSNEAIMSCLRSYYETDNNDEFLDDILTWNQLDRIYFMVKEEILSIQDITKEILIELGFNPHKPWIFWENSGDDNAFAVDHEISVEVVKSLESSEHFAIKREDLCSFLGLTTKIIDNKPVVDYNVVNHWTNMLNSEHSYKSLFNKLMPQGYFDRREFALMSELDDYRNSFEILNSTYYNVYHRNLMNDMQREYDYTIRELGLDYSDRNEATRRFMMKPERQYYSVDIEEVDTDIVTKFVKTINPVIIKKVHEHFGVTISTETSKMYFCRNIILCLQKNYNRGGSSVTKYLLSKVLSFAHINNFKIIN